MSTFQQRKDRILASLSAPEDTYIDLSPKGTVDVGIRDLVEEINSLEGLVTTSSCAGRVAVYLDGGNTIRETVVAETERDASSQKVGSKGGGRWLFVSHDPLTEITSMQDHELLHMLGLVAATGDPSYDTSKRLVHLKFEPMHAKQVLSAAMGSGFRESGISSISDDHSVVMTAVRTNGLAFDSIIATAGHEGLVSLTVSPAHIRMLLELSNSRFSANASRTARFRVALLGICADATSTTNKVNSAEWEAADVRRERKRAEGLRRQQQMQAAKEAQTVTPMADDDLTTMDQLTSHEE